MCHQWLFICSKFFLVSIFLSVEVYLFNDWHFYIQQKFINILQGVVYWMKNSVPQNPSSHVKIIQCGTKIKKHTRMKWGEVLKNGPSKICGRQPLKIWSDMVCLSRPYHFKIFEGCLPQILLGPFLNILAQIS